MTVLHTGSNNTYSERWQLIFGQKPEKKTAAKRTGKTKATKPAAKAKAPKKPAPKKKLK